MPNGEAHEALIRQAYNAIGLDFDGTAMVEAHGKTISPSMTSHFLDIILFLIPHQAPVQKSEIPLRQRQSEDASDKVASTSAL
jgi:hypothetical protein